MAFSRSVNVVLTVCKLLRLFVSLFNQIYFLLRCRDALFQFLLEGMRHLNFPAKLHGYDRAVGVRGMPRGGSLVPNPGGEELVEARHSSSGLPFFQEGR